MSHGTADENFIATKKSRPTKETHIPFVAPEKYADALNLSKTGVTIIRTG